MNRLRVKDGSGARGGYDEAAIEATLGSDIRINTQLLDEFCSAQPTGVTEDLVALLGAVKCADRSFKRHHASGWARHISVELPVFERTTWQSRDVYWALVDCLSFLTGDRWEFEFVRRKARSSASLQHRVNIGFAENSVFVPYSHGLDSYAQLRLLQAKKASEVVCVFTDRRGDSRGWKQFCRTRFGRELKDIPVPVSVETPKHPEPTFRSRPFLYYSIAAYGAMQAKAGRVAIPENGQGSFAGSLVPLGGEALHRSCHPGFTRRLADFLRALTKQPIQFEHPALFDTKSEVLKSLGELEPDVGIWLAEHRSCSHDNRHANQKGRAVHCGVCGNCLLRRVSLAASNLHDSTPYLFADLTAPEIHKSVSDAEGQPRAIKAFEDLAGNTVRSMERFARLSDEPRNPVIWAEAACVADALNAKPDEVVKHLHNLLRKHQSDWKQFKEAAGSASWIQRFADA